MIKAAYHTTKFWILIILLSIVLGTISVLARLFDSSSNLSHKVSSLWGRWLCTLNGIQVDVEGLEHLQQDQAQILIANHQASSIYSPSPDFFRYRSDGWPNPACLKFLSWDGRLRHRATSPWTGATAKNPTRLF